MDSHSLAPIPWPAMNTVIRKYALVAHLVLGLALFSETVLAQTPGPGEPVASPPNANVAEDSATESHAQVDADLASAQVSVAEAEAKADVAEVEAEVAKAEADKAKLQLDEARTGKLIRYGVTAGYAIVGQSRSLGTGTDGAKHRSFNITNMPYLVLAPAYWFMSDQSATFCASSYVDADRAAAATAAFERAKRVARVGLPRQTQLDLDSKEDETKKAAAEKQLDHDARDIFDPKGSVACWPTRFGLYVGKPAEYTASVVAGKGESEANRTVQSTISGGIAFIPNAYITVLLGLSAGSFDLEAVAATETSEAQPERTRRFMNVTFGLGGNLDLLTAIFIP